MRSNCGPQLQRGDATLHTRHENLYLHIALPKAAVMRFRVLATFDPVTTPLKHVLGAEGFLADYL